MRLPIRTRLTLVSALSMAMVLLSLGIFVYSRFGRDLRGTVDVGLTSRAQTVIASLDPVTGELTDESNLIEPDEAFAQVLSSDGKVIDSTANFAVEPFIAKSQLDQLDKRLYLTIPLIIDEELIDARLLVVRAPRGPIVVVGTSLEEQYEALRDLTNLLTTGGAGALVIAAFISWLVAGAALKPVEQMRQEAAAISADEPGRRLPVPSTRDEIARLGETLNDMLARLEDALERERRFVDDAAHELRTPLGNLRTELELALSRARTPDELESAVRSAFEETERLTTLANDLLVLARSERGRVPVRKESVNLATLADEIVGSFAAGNHNGVRIVRSGPDLVDAEVDPLRLRQAIGNLVQNALRHSPADGIVTLEIAASGKDIMVSVSDQGAGFPEDFLPRAFDAFARADAARSDGDGGAGLGMTIARAVAEAHGGTAEVSNNSGGGAVVTLTLPRKS